MPDAKEYGLAHEVVLTPAQWESYGREANHALMRGQAEQWLENNGLEAIEGPNVVEGPVQLVYERYERVVCHGDCGEPGHTHLEGRGRLLEEKTYSIGWRALAQPREHSDAS